MQDFIVDNYILIVVVCLFIIFTLIGYMADKKSKNVNQKVNLQNNQPKQEPKVETTVQNIQPPVSQDTNTEKEKQNIENNATESIKTEPVQEDVKEPTLDDLIRQNNINNNVVQIPKEDDTVNSDDVKPEETTIEEKHDIENKEMAYNDWQPVLEEENNDAASTTEEIKEDSK